MTDQKGTLDSIHQADRVILSIPVKESLHLLPELLDQLHENALLWDVGSPRNNCVRRWRIIRSVNFTWRRAILQEQSFLVLKLRKKVYLLENHKYYAGAVCHPFRFGCWQKQLSDKWECIRFMHPQEHDRHMACVSHLSHISSFMLETVLEQEADEQNIFDQLEVDLNLRCDWPRVLLKCGLQF